MFALRGIGVSFAIFFLVYACLSVAVCFVWGKVRRYGRQFPVSRFSNLLFGLRALPLIAAACITFALTVPSFLLLEPRATDEPVGVLPIVLGLCGIAVILAGVWNGASALLQAKRTARLWSSARTDHASVTSSKDENTGLRVSGSAPPLTVAGLFRPTLWLSQAAKYVLNENELRSALRHEAVHVRRHDNLRKFVLRLVAFPGMGGLERAWREAIELAADDAAVSSVAEALDLAAAIVKLSRLRPHIAPPKLATALVHSPAESVSVRVQRLIAWEQRRLCQTETRSLRYGLCVGAVTLISLALTYGQLLLEMHEATEWLVR
jgi:beta-lactamase regulating signal transducer with metallopeptidase domain